MVISRSSSTVAAPDSWSEWRQRIVSIIRADFCGVLDQIDESDIDWDAWRPFYEEGRSPKSAVDRAFLRDL